MVDLKYNLVVKSVSLNPQILSSLPETFRPKYMDLIGSGDLFNKLKIGLICSIKCPGNIILKTLNLMQSLTNAGLCFVSGFHSPLEQECLSLLLHSNNQLIICPARSIRKMRLPLEFKEVIAANRMAIISPFDEKNQRASEQNAQIRNRLVMALADQILILHAEPGGKVEKLVNEIREWGKAAYSLEKFENLVLNTSDNSLFNLSTNK